MSTAFDCIINLGLRIKQNSHAVQKEKEKIQFFCVIMNLFQVCGDHQRFKKWYLILPCLTFSIIEYGSRVKRSNRENGEAPFPTPRFCS